MLNINNAQIRTLLNNHLRLDTEVDAFCLDFFPEVYNNFSAGMDRMAKLNMLIAVVLDNEKILTCLKERYPNRIQAQPGPASGFKTKNILIGFSGLTLLIIGISAYFVKILTKPTSRPTPTDFYNPGAQKDTSLAQALQSVDIYNNDNLLFDQTFSGYCSPDDCHGLIYQDHSNRYLVERFPLSITGSGITHGELELTACLGGQSTSEFPHNYCISVFINNNLALDKVALDKLRGGTPPKGPFVNFRTQSLELPSSVLNYFKSGSNELKYQLGCVKKGDWIVFKSTKLHLEGSVSKR